MDLKKTTTEQLKALGYDQMALFEATQRNLKLIAEELASRSKTEPEKKEK